MQALTLVGERDAVAAFEAALDRCLVTQEELDAAEEWPDLPHPFPWLTEPA